MVFAMTTKIGELEELEKLRIGQGDEKDVTILRTQQQLDQTESELAEVTELKNAGENSSVENLCVVYCVLHFIYIHHSS